MKTLEADGFIPDAETEDGFIPEGAKPPKPEMESVFLEDKGFNAGIPKGLDLDEINQSIFTTFYHEPKHNFWGGVNLKSAGENFLTGMHAGVASMGYVLSGQQRKQAEQMEGGTEDFSNIWDRLSNPNYFNNPIKALENLSSVSDYAYGKYLETINHAANFFGQHPSDELKKSADRIRNATTDYLVKHSLEKPRTDDNEKPEFLTETLPYAVGQGSISIMSSIAISALMRKPWINSVLFGVQQEGQKYEQMSDLGISADKKIRATSLQKIYEGGLEGIGADFFLRFLRGSKTLTRAVAQVVNEGLFQEASQTAAELMIDKKIAGINVTREEFVNEVAMSALVGMFVSGPVVAGVSIANRNSLYKKIQDKFNLTDAETEKVFSIVNDAVKQTTGEHLAKVLNKEAAEIELVNAALKEGFKEKSEPVVLNNEEMLSQIEQSLLENKDVFTESEFEQYMNDIQEARNRQAEGEVFQEKESQTDTPEFKAWFGDSKVVDKNNKPLVVYHGSGSDFNIFDADMIGSQGTSEGKGFYFTNQKQIAKGYKKQGGKIFEVYLDIKKPFNLTDKKITKKQLSDFIKSVDTDGQGYLSNWGDVSTESYNTVLNKAVEAEFDGSDNDLDIITSIYNSGSTERTAFFETLKSKLGYDGVIVTNPSWGKGQTIYVPFLPTQIKSATDNAGTFDPNNPDIRYQQSEGAPSTFEAELKKAQSILTRNGIQNIVFQLHEVIKAPSGNEAYGSYTPNLGLIKLIQNPLTSTGYHEAFHALVNSAGISQEMMDSVFQEIQQSEGVSASAAEEILADKFADASNQWDSLSGKVKSFFEKIWLYIKQLLGNLNQADRERIFFRALYEGRAGLKGQSIGGEKFQERMTRQKARELADRYAIESESARQAKEAVKPLIEIKKKLKGAFKPYSNNFLKEEIDQLSKYYFSKEGMFLDEGIDKVNEIDQSANLQSDNDLIAYLKNLDSRINEYSRDAKVGSKPTVTIPADQMADLAERPTQGKMDKKIAELRARIETVKQMSVEQRQQLREELLAKQAEIKTVMLGKIRRGEAKVRDLVDYINENLPMARRGRLMKFIKNIKIKTDMVKAFTRVNEEIAAYQHSEAVSRVKAAFEKALDSKQIAVEYTEKIAELASLFDESVPRETTIKRLKATKDFIEAELKAGRDPEIPRYVYESLGRLKMVPMAYLSVAELQNIRDKIDTLVNQGKTKLSARQAVYEALKQRYLQELKNSKPLEYTPTNEPTLDGESVSDLLKDKLKSAFTQAQELHLRIMPMDVLFDLLDGLKNYQGANSRIFKASIDSAFSNYLELKQSVEDDVVQLAKELKMTDKNFNRIGVYAADKQENGREKLLATGFTDEQIDSIALTPDENKLYNAMREKLDLLRPKIAEVMRVVYNKNLDYVEDYFPFMTDFQAMSDFEIQDRFGDSAEQFGMKPKSTPEQGMTKTRLKGAIKQKIKINAMDIFLRHADNASYLVSMGQALKLTNDLARSDEYGKAVGADGQRLVREWLDIIARKGKAKGSGEPLNRWLSVVRKHIGLAGLGFRLSSVLIQPTALFDGAALIGGDHMARGVSNVASSKEWRTFLKDNFTELRERGADDPAYLEFDDGKTLINQGAKAAFWGIKKLDLLTASAITSGAYELALEKKGKTLDLKNPDKAAIQEAERLLRRTQSSGLFKDAPLAISQGVLGNAQIGKLVFQFQSFMLNRWSLIEHDLLRYGILKGNRAQMINGFIFLSMALFAELGIRRFSKELIAALTDTDLPEMDEEEFWKQLGMNALTTVPFVSQIVSSARYGSNPVPAISTSSEVFEYLSRAINAKKSKTKTRNALKAGILASGLLFGIPPGSGQITDVVGKLLE